MRSFPAWLAAMIAGLVTAGLIAGLVVSIALRHVESRVDSTPTAVYAIGMASLAALGLVVLLTPLLAIFFRRRLPAMLRRQHERNEEWRRSQGPSRPYGR